MKLARSVPKKEMIRQLFIFVPLVLLSQLSLVSLHLPWQRTQAVYKSDATNSSSISNASRGTTLTNIDMPFDARNHSNFSMISDSSTDTDTAGSDWAHDTRNEVLDLVRHYMSEHSHEALTEESQSAGYNSTSRGFALGYYSCPMQAGNRIHHFMNSLIWSIVTNRTLLWKYYDRKVCQRVGLKSDPNICRTANTVKDCDTILQRAEWLPSFDKWGSQLNFTSLNILSRWSTFDKQPKHKLWHDGDEKYAGIADTTTSRIVEFAMQLGQDATILKSERKRNYLLRTEVARERARVLLQKGTDYLYGLLFHSAFSFHPSVIVQTDATSGSTSSDSSEIPAAGDRFLGNQSVSVVLHSRHARADDDGSKVKREKVCLEKVLQSTNSTFCQVILLSDREKTLTQLKKFLNDHFPECVALSTSHTLESSFRVDHGPFAGVGFFQDLKLVADRISSFATSKTAFIGPKMRSSSQLVREMEAYGLEGHANDFHNTDLTKCYLEDQ